MTASFLHLLQLIQRAGPNTNVNEKVNIFNKNIPNILSNFISHEILILINVPKNSKQIK